MKRQQGQALPLGISLILFTVLIGIVLFNTGQLVSEKTKLANAADSAVYSGLVWQSRALNFQSYTNRAMVANQVTMAQAVSLRSWTLYGVIATENVNAILGSIPFVGAITSAMQEIMTVTEQLLSPITDGLLSFVDAINGVLSQAQSAMFAATFVATPGIVREVVRKNGRNFHADSEFSIVHAGLNANDWHQFTDQYEEDHRTGMTTKADVINRSRDTFTRTRNWDFFSDWLYIAPFMKVNIQKRGETRLLLTDADDAGEANSGELAGNLKWEWKGKDALSLNTRVRTWRGTKKGEVPIGWGQAYAHEGGDEQTLESSCNQEASYLHGRCRQWLDTNRSAEELSDNNTPSIQGNESREKMSGTYSGLRAYRDLAELGAQERDPRLVLRVEVESPLDQVMTSSKHGIGNIFSTTDSGAVSRDGAGSYASIASGEVYFKKPLTVSQGTHIEYANGYNPFWDVRLTDTPDATRVYALLTRDVPVVSDSLPAANQALEQYVESLQSELGILNAELDSLEQSELSESSNPELPASTDLLSSNQSSLESEIAGLEGSIDSVSSLSTASLTDSMGLGDSAIQQAETLTSSLNPAALQGQLEGFIQQEFDQLAFDPVSLVVDQIRDELEGALASILAGAIEGTVNSSVGANVSDMVGNSESMVDQISESVGETVGQYENVGDEITQAIDEGEQFTENLEAEFIRIQQTVREIYEVERLRLEAELDQALSGIYDQISDIQSALAVEIPENERAEFELQMIELNQQLNDLPQQNLTLQAEMLQEVVNSNTDLYQMDLDTALIIVQMEGDVGTNLIGLVQEDCGSDDANQIDGCEA